jgi:DNA modification methylase
MMLCDKVIKYLCPEAGLVVDPFAGRGNIGAAAIENGCRYIGAEQDAKHFEAGSARLDKMLNDLVPFEK